MRGQGLQGDERVFGNQQRRVERRIGQRGHARARNHCGHGSAFQGGGHKVVPVQALAAHGEEQFARGHGARVNRVAAATTSAPALATLAGASSTAPAPICRFCQCEFHCDITIAQFAER
jgi:hypothetical protein